MATRAPNGTQAPIQRNPSARQAFAQGGLVELAMADNNPDRGIGGLGLLIGALVIVVAAAFLFNGGDRFFGKKTIESDNDLPPVQMSQPKAK
jgi:hypothetical protein